MTQGASTPASGATHLSQSAYARRMGWTPGYVSQLVGRGLVALEAGYVNVRETDARLAANVAGYERLRQAPPDAAYAAGRVERANGAQANGNGAEHAALEFDEYGRPRGLTLTDARTIKVFREAEYARMRAEQAAGRLVDVGEMGELLRRAFAEVRRDLLSLPTRLTAELWEEQDEHRFRERLDEEIRTALRELAQRVSALGLAQERDAPDASAIPEARSAL